MIKPIILVDKYGKITVDEYVDEAIKQGITRPEDVVTNTDGSKNIITDNGYSANIKQDGEHNVIITIDGKAEELRPVISNIQLTTGTNNIKVDVEVFKQ